MWRGAVSRRLYRPGASHGAVDILHTSGELDEWRAGKTTEVATNVQSFTESAHGEVEFEYLSGGHGRHQDD